MPILKNPWMEHCLCPEYGIVYRPDMYNLQVRKKIWQWARVKITFSKDAATE